ncbi:MAG: c-type cytochrome biogenesis protein CcmI [Methylococcales bacterium]|jgi:cytochrome c-type biogenesis protein CcmH|nr:c-type cytochrome biogenesis protein CcmI [Methylococcales bacterium]
MVLFGIVATLLVLIAFVFVVLPLVRPPKPASVSQHALNVEIYKDRLQTLEFDLKSGQLSQDQFKQAKSELDKEVLRDTEQADLEYSDTKPDIAMAIIVAVFVVVGSFAFYEMWGYREQAKSIVAYKKSPKKGDQHAESGKAPSMEAVLEALEEKLVQNPSNAEGWFMLARSYASLKEYTKAEKAYEKLYELRSNDPDVMTDYADVSSAASGQKGFTPKAAELIAGALKIDPKHPRALLMQGFVYFNSDQVEKAVATWQILRGILTQPDAIASLDEYIAMGQQQLGVTPTVATKSASKPSSQTAGAVSLPVNIVIAPELKAKAGANMTVFIFAKAVTGPPMPLAAIKTTVSELGQTFALSDAQAMTPQFKVSKFTEVKLSARIAMSGTPTKQSGDLFAKAVVVKTTSSDLTTLVIDQVFP